MPRTARVVPVGAPHHLTQRGNKRQSMFLADADRRAFLDPLKDSASKRAALPQSPAAS